MAMTIPQAIEELKEQKTALDKHIARGGEYCEDYAEALGMAIKALKKEIPRALQDDRCPICNARNDGDNWCFACGQAFEPQFTECVSTKCATCDENKRVRVCPYYADKVDEICRIHEEG